MKALVTGGAGFIGRWLVKKLLEENFEVWVIDNLENGRESNLQEFHNHPLLKGVVYEDVLNQKALHSVFLIEDAVRAYSLVITEDKRFSGSVFNIGTNKQTSIKNLAHMIKDLTGSKSAIDNQPGRSADLMSLAADYSLIHQQTGWEPKVGLKDGLKRTIQWYRQLI